MATETLMRQIARSFIPWFSGSDVAGQRIEDGHEDERDGERFEDPHYPETELTQLLVAQADQIGILAEGHAKRRATNNGDEDLPIQGERTPV